MKTARPFPAIAKGRGATLYSEEGRPFLDGTSSWWVNLHGHAHPLIAEAIYQQAQRIEQVPFADFTHAPAIKLAERLLRLLPGEMSKVFYSDNGSTAVEIALKMALQYWHNRNPNTQQTKVICLKGSFHGETFGAMSAAGKNHLNQPFWRHLFDVEQIDPPIEERQDHSIQQLTRIIQEGKAACFIFEPLLLGVGGMIRYSAEGLNALLNLCREHHLPTIADEVMTGFGRTGPLFACEMIREVPDIICLAKGLTGGFLPLAVTACRESIFTAFLSDERQKALLHGHSYTANPVACASALASLDLLEQESCTYQRERIAFSHAEFCLRWKGHPKLRRCENAGTVLILEYAEERSYFHPLRDRLYDFFLGRGILLRPLGNVLYVMPPYCISGEDLQTIYDAIILTLEGTL